MNGQFENVHKALNRLPRRERTVVFRQSLARAAGDVPGLTLLQKSVHVNELGVAGTQELAHKLCLWADRVGVLDRLFPLEAVEDRER